MLQGEHSAILSTCIKLPNDFKPFVLSIFEWPLKAGFTVVNQILKRSLNSVIESTALAGMLVLLFMSFNLICMYIVYHNLFLIIQSWIFSLFRPLDVHNQKYIFLFLNQTICCGYSNKQSF